MSASEAHHALLLTPPTPTMNRSLSLLSALTLSSTAVAMSNTADVEAMAIAYDCFDRSTSTLVARSTIDMTSPAVSCLPVPGAATADSVIEANNSETTEVISDEEYDENVIEEEELIADESFDVEEEEEEEVIDDLSTGEALSNAAGEHMGKLIGNIISDIFR